MARMYISGTEPPSAILSQGKSKKYRGVFQLKSRVKKQVSGRAIISVPYRHATIVQMLNANGNHS